MPVTNTASGTRIDEIAEGIFRISTAVEIPGTRFSFNQYLVKDDQPLLFHTGPRRMFPLVREAVDTVLPAASLRHISFSHIEADETGSLNDWLAVAPQAQPLCGRIGAMVSVEDMADRPPRALGDGERLSLGGHEVEWIDAPHLPHSWECGFLFDHRTRTLFCGDLLTQPGDGLPALTEADILGPSEAFRAAMDYYSHTRNAKAGIERLAATAPTTLACMHGSAWKGDGGSLLRALGEKLGQ